MTLLSRTEATLPATWYYDPDHYQRELEAVWYRDWVCVGRQEEIPRRGDYLVAEIGTQQVIVTRNSRGAPKAFHNTCRHRGSLLCQTPRGHFGNGRIVCPYHTWTYSLDGELIATPARLEADDFCLRHFPLYDVHVDSWGGFLFVNLAERPSTSLSDFLATEADVLDHWPLSTLISAHQEKKILACNWKVFWENYSECYHCPRLHPELCRVVPLYRKGVLRHSDLPDWQPEDDQDDGRPTVAPGLSTWTMDGRSTLPAIEGLDERYRDDGMAFASFTASMYVVGHPDYVRSVRLQPRGPETVELTIDWLLPPGVRETHADTFEEILKLAQRVIEQDSRACELNQQGLKSVRHRQGVLVPQEYALWEFHEWLRARIEGTQLKGQ
jgi:glycine betaine catabolism A